jgi:hypothetical protein
VEIILKLFEVFREFLTGLARLFVFWPDSRVLLRRTVAWCRTHELREAWIAFWMVGTAFMWSVNSVLFTAATDIAGTGVQDVINGAASQLDQLRRQGGNAGTWEGLKSLPGVMFNPGFLLSLSPKQRTLTSLLQALAMTTLSAAIMGMLIRVLPRVRSPKKQSQVWAMSVAAVPMLAIPLLFGMFGVVVLYAVPQLALFALALGIALSMAFSIGAIALAQRAFRLTGRRYWLFTVVCCVLIAGLSLLGAFSTKPYADLAKAILGNSSIEKEK